MLTKSLSKYAEPYTQSNYDVDDGNDDDDEKNK